MKNKQEGQNQDLIRYEHIEEEKKYRSQSITGGRQKSYMARPTEAQMGAASTTSNPDVLAWVQSHGDVVRLLLNCLPAQEHQMSNSRPDKTLSWRHTLFFFCRNHAGVFLSVVHSSITTHISAIINVVIR